MAHRRDYKTAWAKMIMEDVKRDEKEFIQVYIKLLAQFLDNRPVGNLTLESHKDLDFSITFFSNEIGVVTIYDFSPKEKILRQFAELIKVFKGEPYNKEKLDSLH